ncbi:hypothetical protein BYT27DRAFT_7182464 [Phlegmacium glaucopus]|nr:hypothetical protein BYT27DRAFT_7182464 [Phlegmacium glaucopus]
MSLYCAQVHAASSVQIIRHSAHPRSVAGHSLTSTRCALIVNVPNRVSIYTFTNTRTFSRIQPPIT